MVLRSFLAFVLPEELLKVIVETQEKLRHVYSGFRWVAKENLHLTIHFLGNQTEEQLKEIAKQCIPMLANFRAVQVVPGKIGAFPNRYEARVLWFSLRGEIEEIRRIHNHTGTVLQNIGCQIEERPFFPHITIARKRAAERDTSELREYEHVENSSFLLKEINLYTSRLTPDGPIYSVYCNFPLKNNHN
ncbi:MAG: RNA 2',3'-cyclic phosphodiesterase [Peptococcaceae bacterium]|jgi:2'-5' RNA ligase|nr:RNA 2',3'-cyclic phosphodiesterase [Peptococcaceae bacterium]MDH7524114.1 RNA 2',3'-cyclic phosphodiesterase [Peptococcaceae bacterium]